MMKVINMNKARWSREPNRKLIFDLAPGDVFSIQGVDTKREYITIKIAPEAGHSHPVVKTVVEIDEDKNTRAVSFVFPVDTAGPDPDPIRLEARVLGKHGRMEKQILNKEII